MRAVTVVSGRALPLARSDVDTDQIIPSGWLKRVERTGFGAGLFAEWRDEQSFVLNRPEHAGARILLAGPNFGTGSSREHAVWALTDYGFEAVVSARFGDIFRNNAAKAGLVPAEAGAELVEALMAAVSAKPELELTIDLERRSLEAPAVGLAGPFHIDEAARYRLLNGLDDIGLSLRHLGEIESYEARRPSFLPSLG